MSRNKIRIAGLAVLISAGIAVSAQAATNNILSANIKEADGTSGQNTNTGSGVKTNHLQDGAVTDAKISGVISPAKLPIGTTAGTVATGDHNHTIANNGFSDRGAAMVNLGGAAALSHVTATASGGNYRVGIYSSGFLATMHYVTATASSANTAIGVWCRNNLSTALDNVTAAASAWNSYGIQVSGSPAVRVKNSDATASGGGSCYGFSLSDCSGTIGNVTAAALEAQLYNFGLLITESSELSVRDTIATASGGSLASNGIRLSNSSVTMSNITAIATNATENFGLYGEFNANAVIDRSTLTGSTNSVSGDAGVTVRFGASKLVGGVATAGTISCVASYDGNYAALDTNCQ